VAGSKLADDQRTVEEAPILSYPRLTKCMPDETRHNPFHALHKALRYGHCRMLSGLGAQDFGDDAAAGRLLPQLVMQLELFQAVAEARHAALLDALARRGLEAPAAVCQDHASHMTALAELQSLVRAVNVAAPQRRRLAARSIYRCYALYTSADMERMDEEETVLLTTLQGNLGEEDLRAITGRTLGRLTPAQFEQLARLLLPALSVAELEILLSELRDHMDPAYFTATVEPAIRTLLAARSSAAA
jgi:hypothetical protein